MTCYEFQQELPELVDGGRTAEQESHLNSCRSCSELLADLTVISELASSLQASEDPNPRVWNSIEAALRKEGLIRQPQREPGLALVSRSRPRPLAFWWAPVAATLLIVAGLLFYGQLPFSRGSRSTPAQASLSGPKLASFADKDDQQMLEVVQAHAPGMRAAYANNLRAVNAYIQDAEESVQQDPNDEDARETLVTAYEQKAVVYEMAMDRSLP